MITVTGRVVDENLSKMPGLVVEAVGDWLLTSKVLASDITDSAGQYVLEVPEIEGFDDVPRSFNLRVKEQVTKRVLTRDKLLGGSDKNQVVDITVQSADAKGLLVTNGTGVADFVSEGNAVKLLVDGVEAFGQVAEDIEKAKSSINLTQLFFSLPKTFDHEPAKEEPELIFKFLAPDLVPFDPLVTTSQPAAVPRGETANTHDQRPERLLIKSALAKTKIRLLLNEPSLSWPEGIFYIGVISSLAIGLGAEGITALLALIGLGLPFFFVALALLVVAMTEVEKSLNEQTHVDEARNYFAKAIADGLHAAPPVVSDIVIRGFRQNFPKDGVFHCKMMITDEERAVIIGSPFKQRYFDSLRHSIVDAHRGINSSEAIHDLSVSVVGPAVHDLYDSFLFFWNEDIGAAKLKNESKVPTAVTTGPDPICKVQVVRTLNGTRFNSLNGKSEKGILEGYLRAFAEAEHYIYLENQYFTDAGISDALVAVLKKNTDLELILVVPINPDVWFYPGRQADQIAKIREAGGDRVGVFTRWAYDENHPRPWVAPVYIHAKGAVIDDSWATVGSANLDGFSLDYNLVLSPLAFGETIATELNVNMIPPSKGAVTPFAEQMRKRLFAEQLGIIDAAGNVNPNDPLLQHGPEHKWLKELWRPRAKANLDHVKAGLKKPLPGFVLEYPLKDGGCLDTPRKHLRALGVNTDQIKGVVRPLSGTRKFHFNKGEWDRKAEREDLEGARP